MTDTAPASKPARDIAAEHMVTGIPRAHIDTTVDQIIEALRGTFFECADTVFVTDTVGRLQGIVRINNLFADGQRKIGDIMEPEHESVGLGADQEQIAALAMRLNMIAVPVVDHDGRLDVLEDVNGNGLESALNKVHSLSIEAADTVYDGSVRVREAVAVEDLVVVDLRAGSHADDRAAADLARHGAGHVGAMVVTCAVVDSIVVASKIPAVHVVDIAIGIVVDPVA